MRKHPLIALTAFAALTASAIAGATTGQFTTTTMLTAARTEPKAVGALGEAETLASIRVFASRDLGIRRSGDTAARERFRSYLRDLDGLPVPTWASLVTHELRRPHRPAASTSAASTPPVYTPPALPAPVVTTTTSPPAAPAGGVWYELRVCESGDDYSADTGNGYYGAYQFSLSTWWGLGFSGLPSDASPAVQDEAAEELEAEDGWEQWPACAAELGL